VKPFFLFLLSVAFGALALIGCGGGGGGGGHHPPDASVLPPDASVPPPADAGVPPDAAAPPCAPPPTLPARRFTIAVIPDTQYLFDGDRGDASVLAASVHWIIDHSREYNIVFTAGLGDIVQNADPTEFDAADQVYQLFDAAGIQYSLPPGNHDMTHSSQYDDQRGNEPYLTHFSPARFMHNPTFGGATPNGYNSYYIFEGSGQKWLLFALDWRMSSASMQWVQTVMSQHATLPVILTMHELVDHSGVAGALPGANAVLSDYGQTVWDTLIKNNDQVFLGINGHFWTPARATFLNGVGHEVRLHLTNYQDRYYGGSGMIRLYEFDLDRNTIEVSTHSPYMSNIPEASRTAAQQQEVERSGPDDHFIEYIDFQQRFSGFTGIAPPAPPPPAPPPAEVIPGTVAYWRFDGNTTGPVTTTIPDQSGNGNDLIRVTTAGGADGDLTWTNTYHPYQPSRGALFFNGSKSTPPSYLRTGDNAPINTMAFASGYTIEAFVHLPADCCGAHAWMGILSRFGTGGDAGKHGDDPLEPVATLSVTGAPGFQWADFPLNFDGIKTNWSHITPPDTWQHVAVVNDGHHSIMYVEGAPVLQNPKSESIGISSAGDPWLVGAYSYDHKIDQAFYGWLGDVRIVDHALTPDQFMTARN
jgi:hypothetical protein